MGRYAARRYGTKRYALLFAVIAALAAAAASFVHRDVEIGPNSFYEVRVERVVDGDTIVAAFEDGSSERVRLIGVNTPESVAPNRPVEHFGKEASKFTTSALTGRRVFIQTDAGTRDKYKRVLAYVWLQMPGDPNSEAEIRAKMFNARLLLDGYARTMNVKPNTRLAKLFATFQKEAKSSGVGLWAKTKKK